MSRNAGQTGLLFHADASQARADGPIIGGRQRESLLRQPPQCRLRQLVPCTHASPAGWRDNRRAKPPPRRPDNSSRRRESSVGPPISIFSISSAMLRAVFRGHFLERVQIHHYHVDGAESACSASARMCSGLARMARIAAGDARIDGFQPAVQHLRKAGDIGNLAHRDAAFLDCARGASGGNDFHAQIIGARARNPRFRFCL